MKNGALLTPWWKTFLTSILGTTISIALTFGTSAWVSSSKKKAAQRLTAMMIIDDIDKSIDILKKIRDNEETGYNAAMYVREHIDSLESLSDDTLNIVYDYLLEGFTISSEFEFSESTEKMFHSTQDSWSNLSSVKFVRNIEVFYKDRKMLNELNSHAAWKKPVLKAETDSVTMNSDILDSKVKVCAYLKNVLNRRRCKKYLETYINRLNLYNRLIEGWTNLNDENKFLMNITDEELKEFVEKTSKQDRPANEKDIIGTWVMSSTDSYMSEFEFKKDYTFHNLQSFSMHHKNLAGKAYMEITVTGKWHMESDSLIIVFDPTTAKTHVNDSSLVYREELRDSIQRELHEYMEAQLPHIRKSFEENGGRLTKATSIDLTGNKLELTNSYGGTTHYKRKK